MLDKLKKAQEIKGYLSDDDIRKVAKEYGKAPSEVYETATFYSMLHVGTKPTHLIEVCGSTCCDAQKASKLMSDLSKELGITSGQISKDGQWMLRRCECLGRCDSAPNAMVDGKLITNAKAEEIVEMIRKAGN